MFKLLSFSFWEAVTSLWRSRILNLVSVGTIMFAMFILGSFIFVGLNLKKVTIAWQEQIQFNVFLEDDILEAQKKSIQGYFEESLFVDKVVYLSKEEARKRFGGNFSSYGDVVDQLDQNPFPASFQIFLLKGTGGESFQVLKEGLETFQGIEEVYYDEEIFKRLEFFADLIGLTGWFFGGIMIFSSIFTISNVLKLTFFSRREEVDIMKLVGASRAFIRGPFIVEGILIGILGAIFGILLVLLGFLGLNYYLKSHDYLFVGDLELVFLPFRWVLVLICAGGFSGLLGSIISLNQFLEEHISYQ